MKKILGISLVALFAAMPTIAGAANMADAPTVAKADEKLATVSYVIGAYDAAKAAVNTKQDQLKVGETAINSAVVGTSGMHVSTSEGINSASDSALVTEKAVLTAIDSAVTTANTAMDTRVDALESAVNDESTGLATKASSADLSALGTRVGTLESAGYITKDVNDLTNYTTTTDMNTELNKKINSSAIATAINSQSTNDQVAGASAVYSAVEAAKSYADGLNTTMNGRVTDLETTAGNLASTYATQSGVAATINSLTYTGTLADSGVTGTVTAMANWGDSVTTTNIPLQGGKVSSDSVTVTASTAAYKAQ